MLYARTESMLGDWQKAGDAYRHAIDLGQKAPDVFAGYGEMLVLAADGIVSPAAHDAFAAALAADPKNDVARYYLALADEQAGEEQRAIDAWLALAADIPDDSPMREAIARGIAEAAKARRLLRRRRCRRAGAAAAAGGRRSRDRSEPGPDGGRGADAGGQRKQMIQGMVAQLAAQSADRSRTTWRAGCGWAAPTRCWASTDKAVDAFDHAAKLKPDDAGIKLQEFETLIAKLQPSDPLPPRAVALLQQVAAIAPDQPEVLWYLGVQAARDGNPDEARRDWTKLLATLPADGEDAKMVKSALDTLPK